jgi:hypothetical protein
MTPAPTMATLGDVPMRERRSVKRRLPSLE